MTEDEADHMVNVADTSQPTSPIEALMSAGFGEPAESTLERHALLEALGQVWGYVHPNDLELLELKYVQNKTYDELAVILDCSSSTAQRHVRGAQERLRLQLCCHPEVIDLLGLDDGGWEVAAQAAAWRTLNEQPLGAAIPLNETKPEWLDVSHQARLRARSSVAELIAQGVHESPLSVAELIASKQRDYGHGNILAFGPFGVLVRLSDKEARLANLAKRARKAVHESVVDTHRDIIGYAVIALMNLEGTFTRELTQ